MVKTKTKDVDGLRLRCVECLSRNIYTLTGGTIVCRRCGHRENFIKNRGGKK